MYPSRKQALELRIQDLNSRLEELCIYRRGVLLDGYWL